MICRFSYDNLYLIGFRPSRTNTWFFLENWLPGKKRDESEVQVTGFEFFLLDLDCKYEDLEKEIPRKDLWIGKNPFIRAVLALKRFRIGQNEDELRRHVLQICQIFCEPMRIRPVLDEICEFYDSNDAEGGKLTQTTIKMQNNWAKSCIIYGRRICYSCSSGYWMMIRIGYLI